jgi:hypothetical protein
MNDMSYMHEYTFLFSYSSSSQLAYLAWKRYSVAFSCFGIYHVVKSIH